MYPVLFDLHLGRLGTFTIGTYGLFYALGFLLALRLGVIYARREGIETARIVDLGIVALLAGFVGGHHVHERMGIAEQELHQSALDFRRLAFIVRGGK